MEKLIKVTFNDELSKKYPINTTIYEVSQDCKSVKNEIIGAKIDNEVVPMDLPLTKDTAIEFFDVTDLIGYKMYQAGLKFLFEVALKEIKANAEVTYLHSIARGMVARINNTLITKDDLSIIKGKMASLIEDDLPFENLNILSKEAINYYKNHGMEEKALNVHNSNMTLISMYRLKKNYNYFYINMPYSTKCLKKFDLVFLNKNKVAILYPSPRSNGKIPEYVNYQGIIDSFERGSKWLTKQHTPYVSDINNLVSHNKIIDYIRTCETYYNNQIFDIAEMISNDVRIKYILLAGPSSSGKTTSTKKLALTLRSKGYNPIVISTDDYFVDREKTPKDGNGKYDYECLWAIDLERFNQDLIALGNGEEVHRIKYNFVAGKREETNEVISAPGNAIILIEGLHCLNNELTPHIPENKKFKVYLSPFIPLNIDRHNYISTVDLRLIRRITRDNLSRGVKVADTIAYWQNVRHGEEKYIFPYIHQADVILNTALAYELGVLKVLVEPLLYSVEITSPYYEEARRLINFLKPFMPINPEEVPTDSIIREFIGRSIFE